jgi:glycosyltransferase involved in cell wall biosynthesis
VVDRALAAGGVTALSIIIPTRDRAARLRACLESLAHQSADPADFEVIVVNDGSADETEAMLGQLETPFPLCVVDESGVGPAGARNRGLATAGGQYCLFLDDDVAAAPGLVKAHLTAQSDSGGVIGIGKLEWRTSQDASWIERAHLSHLARYFGSLETGEREPGWIDCYSGNLSAPTSSLRSAGGFDAALPLAHDAHLGFRLLEAGLALRYLPEAMGIHDGPKTTRTRIAEFEREGADAVLLWRFDRRTMPVVLGAFENSTARVIRARRLLLAARIPARVVYVLCLWLRLLYSDAFAYRFFNDYCKWLGVKRMLQDRRLWSRLTRGTPVLMYHGFCSSHRERSRYVVSRRQLRRQLRLLKAMRYQVIPLEQLVDCIAECELPPAKALAITIDDGYESSFSIALPLLARFGCPATYFVVSQRLGQCNTWDREAPLAGSPVMGLEQLQTVAATGMSVGAHTRTHADVTRLDGRLAEEVAGSRRDLERALGRTVSLFSFPWGLYDERALAAVKAAGYRASCTSVARRTTAVASLLELPRIEIKGRDSMLAFAGKVGGWRRDRKGGR